MTISVTEPVRRPDTPAASPGLWRRWRQRLLASSGFQRWAAALPLTRPIARRKAADLFALCTGFVHAQVLLACVELDLFRIVQAEPLSAAELSDRSGLGRPGAERLLLAAASLDLVHRLEDGRYTLGDLGAALLGNPSVFAMIRHHGDLYRDLADPLALLRERTGETRLARYWRYGRVDDPAAAAPEAVSGYSALMAETQAFIADDVLAAYRFGRHRHVMDVGGGDGAFLAALGQRHPGLQRTLCDLPAVADLARARFSAEPPDRRVRVFGLDAMADPLPDDTDLITLIRILHDHDDGPVRALLAKARRSLVAGGTLLIAEPMAGTRGARPMGDSYFGLYLWAMGSGRPRTRETLTAMLHEAGFTRVREARTRYPLLVRCLVAR